MPTISADHPDSRARLNARWELADAQVARAVREHGSLPAEDLSEEEIASIAVEMTGRSEV